MSVTLGSKVGFETLCNVLDKISLAKTQEKTTILEKFIDQCRTAGNKLRTIYPDADVSLFPVLRLILPHLERDRGPQNLKEKSLANLYVRIFCLGKGSKDANKLVHYNVPTSNKSSGSDFAGRVYWVLQNRLSKDGTGFSVEKINMFLDEISKENQSIQQKDEAFRVLIKQTNALELKWITRIILKDMKLGIGTKRIFQALHPDANALFSVSTNLRQVCDSLHNIQMRYHRDIQVFSHFKPMLLERCNIENTEKLFHRGEQYFVQLKYDGERSQMHMKDGKYKYFTRQGYDITNNTSFGESSSGALTDNNSEKRNSR